MTGQEMFEKALLLMEAEKTVTKLTQWDCGDKIYVSILPPTLRLIMADFLREHYNIPQPQPEAKEPKLKVVK